MPKINRIRIVNFSYNNNKRHILDETFDFFGGQNALLSLSNGGGKSVLVQAILQPILPKISLLNRRFKDFFTARNTPSYIMLEWLLDDAAGYLLTGIAVSPVTHSSAEGDEASDIRYYTFTSMYEEASPYDIKHIPTAEYKGTNIKIASYSEFKKLLQKEADKFHYNINVYNSVREDQGFYQKKLSSYGIFRDEWKDLIRRINEAENGVSEVFSNCKTSRTVMDQWIIKYIEKVLDKSSDKDISDHKKLENMMSSVAFALVENEQSLKEYTEIQTFKSELEGINEKVKDVLTSLDLKDQAKRHIANGYEVIRHEDDKLEKETKDIDMYLVELENERDHIYLEEKSFQIYGYDKEIKDLSEQLELLLTELDKREKELEEIKFQIKQQEAAEINGDINGKDKELATALSSLDNAEKEEEQYISDLNRVKYSLKVKYEALFKEKQCKVGSLEDSGERLKKLSKDAKDSIDRSNIKLNELNRKEGQINERLIKFEKDEQSILDKLGIKLFRNPLLNELDPQDINGNIESFNNNINSLKEQIQKSRNEKQELENREVDLKEEDSRVNKKLNKLNADYGRLKSEIKACEGDIAKVIRVMKKYNLDEELLFNKDILLKTIIEKRNEWDSKLFRIKMRVSEIDKRINGMGYGVSYMPEKLITILKEHNIACYTGEKFLSEMTNAERRDELIKDNPLLPYALIVTEKEYDAIYELLDNEEFSQIIPIMRYNLRESKFYPIENIDFFTNAQIVSLGDEQRAEYLRYLKDEKGSLLLEQEKVEDIIEDTNSDYQAIILFNWQKELVDDLYLEDKECEKLLKLNKEQLDKFRIQKDEIEGEKANLIQEIDVLSKGLDGEVLKLNEFEEYLSENAEYMSNLENAESLGKQIGEVQNDIEGFNDTIKDAEKKLDIIRIGLNDEKRSKEMLITKYTKVQDAKGDNNEDYYAKEGVSQLEGRFDSYNGKQNDNIIELRNRVGKLNQEKLKLKRKLDRLGLKEEDYINISYSEDYSDRLQEQARQGETNTKEAGDDYNKLDKKIEGIKGKRETYVQSLGNKEILPMENIKGNFKNRINEVENKRKLNNKRKIEIGDIRQRINSLAIRIEAQVQDIQITKSGVLYEPFEDVEAEIAALLSDYKQYLFKVEEDIGDFNKLMSGANIKYLKTTTDIISQALKGLLAQADGLEATFEKYYYFSERCDANLAQLDTALRLMAEKVNELEEFKNDLIQHSFMEAMRIYREIPKVSDNSYVTIDGVRKKILDIQYDEIQDETKAKEKMEVYINECLETIKVLIKSNEDGGKVRRELEKFMSTKELLNVICSLDTCVVKAYKVDINEKNRRMMSWEEIIVKNSGGEKFVAYFSLLVALISYSRKQQSGADALRKKEQTKVLIMDNPFGPITSAHLLKPMFDIAEKYDTQLICLSDITLGKVINSFNLIYMIKVKQNMMQEDFLESKVYKSEGIESDEKLEKTYLNVTEQQEILF